MSTGSDVRILHCSSSAISIFLDIDNPHLLAYYKVADTNLVICVVTLDPYQAQEGTLKLPLETMGLADRAPFQVDDLLGGSRYNLAR